MYYYYESLLVLAIYCCIGHAWMSFIRNGPRRALRLLQSQIEKHHGPNARPTRSQRVSTLLVWAFIAPLFWPIDMFKSARKGQLPKT